MCGIEDDRVISYICVIYIFASDPGMRRWHKRWMKNGWGSVGNFLCVYVSLCALGDRKDNILMLLPVQEVSFEDPIQPEVTEIVKTGLALFIAV